MFILFIIATVLKSNILLLLSLIVFPLTWFTWNIRKQIYIRDGGSGKYSINKENDRFALVYLVGTMIFWPLLFLCFSDKILYKKINLNSPMEWLAKEIIRPKDNV